MRFEKLVGERFKERPANCVVDSHALMIRGGYMKYVASGIYTLAMPLRRITRKIEQIIREEMDAIEGQEVLFPVVLPGALWMESGRYYEVQDELVRLNDRHGTPYVLGMTHEEPAVQLVKDYAQSYATYPFMIYQIQTKFRDEMRPKSGLLRVREFTMKDAYSFHTSQEDLEAYYDRCYVAYDNVFYRAGLTENVITVASDNGMMGGDLSHEFMLLSPIGEDSLAICSACDYRSNLEVAESIVDIVRDDVSKERVLEHTPDAKTIDAVSEYLGVDSLRCTKAVVYQRSTDNSFVVVFIRGDLELSEAKLKKYLGCDIVPAVITESDGICVGYIGPQDLDESITVLFDNSLNGANNLICGANKDRYHYSGFDTLRDVTDATYSDFAKIEEGGICPQCRKPAITIARGIEVGNIFQLGTKYSEAMSMTYTDQEGVEQFPIMGCYGIGVGRLAASVCEAYHDEYGPIWPMSIAPWQVHICAIRADNPEVTAASAKLYADLTKAGVEVIIDDRVGESAGVMFADADLLGVPIRAVISPKTVGKGILEVTTRDKSLKEEIPMDSAVSYLQELIERMLRAYDVKTD